MFLINLNQTLVLVVSKMLDCWFIVYVWLPSCELLNSTRGLCEVCDFCVASI